MLVIDEGLVRRNALGDLLRDVVVDLRVGEKRLRERVLPPAGPEPRGKENGRQRNPGAARVGASRVVGAFFGRHGRSTWSVRDRQIVRPPSIETIEPVM